MSGGLGKGPVRVLVVAEIRLYREGLAEALGREPSIVVAGVLSEVAGASAISSTDVDVVVFDTTVRGSFDAVYELASGATPPRIVALGVREDDADIAACVAAGVSGFVARDASFEELMRTVIAVARGESACTPTILDRLLHRAAALRRIDQTREPALTLREREVLALVGEGLSNKEIADHLSIELSTVKNHVHNAFDKLQVRRRADAIARMRLGDAQIPLAIEPR